MSARSLGLVAALAALMLIIVLWMAGSSPERVDDALKSALIPGLAEQINEIEAIDIVGADGETVASLRRERERWRLREKFDYEADFARIHGLLSDLARARRLEPRTDDPQWHARLGVSEPGAGEGAGMRINFVDSGLPGLIIGRPAPGGLGHFVRLADEPQTWLADRIPEIPAERMDWLERAIMDIPTDSIAAVDIHHPDGEAVRLRPADPEGGAWVVLDAPPEREVRPGWEVRQTANALSRLNLNDLRPHEAIPEDAVIVRYQSRDGLDFEARLFTEESVHWVHFRVSPAVRGEDQAAADDAAGNSIGAADGGDPDQELKVDAIAVDGRLSPWQFAVDATRFEQMTRRLSDLLLDSEGSGN